MSKDNKKAIRQKFRDTCFARDAYKCVMCGFKSSKKDAEKDLDCHHIQERKSMPNGGYVKENGISLCGPCHIKAEEFYSTGTAVDGYAPTELYIRINSSYDLAVDASHKLG
jgi:5-methylcytosine-specific restriction endonuclease McrA